MAPFSGAFAQSGGTRRCRFIVHIADLSALGLIHELPECTTKGAILIKWATRDLNPEPSE
jgi:hypothetical protein